MKRLVIFSLLLFGCTEVYSQGSAPAPAQLWRRYGTADTARLITSTGDTMMVYDSSILTVFDLRGSGNSWYFPDQIKGHYFFADTTSSGTQGLIQARASLAFGNTAFDGYLISYNSATPESLSTFLGDGLSITNYALTADIGSTVNDSAEVANQTIKPVHIDSTGSYIMAHAYKTSSADVDYELVTKRYADTTIAGLPVGPSSPTDGQSPVYSSGSGTWQFGSSGTGGGDNIAFDTTFGTAPGSWDPAGVVFRPDGQMDVYRTSGPADTGVLGIKGQTFGAKRPSQSRDTARYSDSVYLVSPTTASDTFLMVNNNGTTTWLNARGSNNAFRIGKPLTVDGNVVLATAGKIVGPGNLYIDDASGIFLGYTDNVPVSIGSLSSPGTWVFSNDSLRSAYASGLIVTNVSKLAGNNLVMDSAQSIDVDTIKSDGVIRPTNNYMKIISDTGTAGQTSLSIFRRIDSLKTNIVASGTLALIADPGLGSIDSTRQVGPWYSAYKPFDSLSRLSIAGSSGGTITNLVRASGGTSYTATIPNVAPTTTGRYWWGVKDNVYGWYQDTTGSGGAGTVNWDTLGTKDTTILHAANKRIFKIAKTASTVTTISADSNTTLEIGTTSGVVTADTALLTKNMFFGASVDTTYLLNSAYVDSIKHRKGGWATALRTQYVRAGNVYGRSKPPSSSDSVYLTTGHWMDSASGRVWDWTDSSKLGADTDYVYQDFMFPDTMLVDSIAFFYITSAADSTGGIIDTVKVYKQWSTAMGAVMCDTLKVTNAARKMGTTAARHVFAVNGATGWAVSRGETWTVKFRVKFPALAVAKAVRVSGLMARGVYR